MLKIHIFTQNSHNNTQDEQHRSDGEGNARAPNQIGDIMRADGETQVRQNHARKQQKRGDRDGKRRESQRNRHGAGNMTAGTRTIIAVLFVNQGRNIRSVLAIGARS